MFLKYGRKPDFLEKTSTTSKLNTICMCRNFDFISDVLAVRQLHRPLFYVIFTYVHEDDIYFVTLVLKLWQALGLPLRVCAESAFFSVLALTTWWIHMR